MITRDLIDQTHSVIDGFLSEYAGRGVILYGAGYAAPIISAILADNGIGVLAVVDSNASLHGTHTVFGAEIMSLNQALAAHSHAKVVISSPRYFLEIREFLISTIGFEAVIPFDIYNAHYFSGAQLRSYLLNHYNDYTWLSGRLADELSRVTLDRVIWAHLTGTVENFMLACTGTEDWYGFHELVRPTHEDVFIDCGAFDGDTALLFDRVTSGKYRAIIACEPNPRVFQELVRNTSELPQDRLYLKRTGAGAIDGELELVDEGVYSATEPGNRRVGSASGTRYHVSVRPLDTLVTDLGIVPTIVKMDIEGAEYDALSGMKGTIARAKPRLSVCLYHRHDDLLRIPRLIESVRNDYRFHLRHQSTAATDTMLIAT